MKVRLQKYLADAGIASRRACEAIIVAGRVTVNGQTVVELGSRVDPTTDRVSVDGRPARPRRKLYVALNKPAGYVCSRRVEGKQRMVGELLPREWTDLYPVGRLDRDSEGLLLLTNDGEFCLRLTHPRYGVEKTYVATVEGHLPPAVLARLKAGIADRGEQLRALDTRLISANSTRTIVELDLGEGKNHEVRRMFESQGFPVLTLRRIRIGPLKLGELPAGKYRVLSPVEVKSLSQPPPAATKAKPDKAAR